MQPNKEDMARLWDMLDAARAAMQFTGDKRFEEFLADRMVRNAVERNLEIIGEAARCISQAFRDAHPEIPWRAIIALRNVLSHEYGEIPLRTPLVLVYSTACRPDPATGRCRSQKSPRERPLIFNQFAHRANFFIRVLGLAILRIHPAL